MEDPVLGLTRLLIEDRLFSCLHDAVLAEAEVRDLIVRHIHDLSSGLHDAEITEGVFFCVDREERIPLFRGNVWFSCFKAEGVHLVGFVDPGNPLNGVKTFGAFSVPGRSVVLIICNVRDSCIAAGRVRIAPGRHQDPACLHFSVDEGVVISVDLLVILGSHHLSVGVKVVPALRRSRHMTVFLQADPSGLHRPVFFCSKIVSSSVDLRLSCRHMAGLVKIVPFRVKFYPFGDSGLSILFKVVPEGIGSLRGVRIFLIL